MEVCLLHILADAAQYMHPAVMFAVRARGRIFRGRVMIIGGGQPLANLCFWIFASGA